MWQWIDVVPESASNSKRICNGVICGEPAGSPQITPLQILLELDADSGTTSIHCHISNYTYISDLSTMIYRHYFKRSSEIFGKWVKILQAVESSGDKYMSIHTNKQWRWRFGVLYHINTHTMAVGRWRLFVGRWGISRQSAQIINLIRWNSTICIPNAQATTTFFQLHRKSDSKCWQFKWRGTSWPNGRRKWTYK